MNVTIRLQLGNKLAVNLCTISHLCHCLASLGGSCSSSSSSLHLFSHRAFWFSWRKYFALYSTKLLFLANKEHFNRCVGKLGLWRAQHFSEMCQFDEASNRTMDTATWVYICSASPLLPLNRQLEHDTDSANEFIPWARSPLLFQPTAAKTFGVNVQRLFGRCTFQGPIQWVVWTSFNVFIALQFVWCSITIL